MVGQSIAFGATRSISGNVLRPAFPTTVGEEDVSFYEMDRASWLAWMRREWRQGQHITIMGRTGRGKTFLARDLLTCREYVCALAIKRADDTLDTFPNAGYRLMINKRWPPPYGTNKVLYWARPKNLTDVANQRKLVSVILDDAYENGGWTMFYDDVAFIASPKGLNQARNVGTLFNQARSSHSSQVAAMTQPSSITQAIPSEVWRQARFHLIFYYRVGRDLEVISDIVGYRVSQLKKWMAMVRAGPYDFLCFDDLTDQVILVRS